jgi:PhnB protein
MTTQINPYLTFSGQCREAMNFYKSCLGGELTVQTVGESPMGSQFPAAMQNNVLHASLVKGPLVLFGSDMAVEGEGGRGSAISLSLTCSTEEELHTCFARLSAGGKVQREIHDFFAGKIGAVQDKYGINWIFYYGVPQS